jgi:hypothetical protein
LIQLGGFRFGPCYPELAIGYRFLATEGRDSFAAAGNVPASQARSRLNLQMFDLDCLRRDCPIRENLLLSWDAGVRLLVVFFDTQVETATSYEQARNYFFGAGPHAGVGLTYLLPNGFGVYGHFDAGLLVGYNTAQNFVHVSSDAVDGNLSGTAQREQTDLSPSFTLQAGLTWTPVWLPPARLRAGYEFEQWYNLGHVGASRGNLNAHSLSLGVEACF